MRYLGLDLGTKTLGLSISDETHTIASTYKTISFSLNDYDSLIPILADIIKDESISKLILGLPKNMNNTYGESCERTIEFKKKLEKNFDVEIILQDERLTTKQAESYMLEANVSRKKRKQKIDSLAANIILQTYLDKERGGIYEGRSNDI